MNFFKIILNKIDSYIYYLEFNFLVYITSIATIFSLLIIWRGYPGGNFFATEILLITILIVYLITLLLLCVYNVNKLFFNQHLSFNNKFPKWYRHFWRFNVMLNICFHLFILYLILDILPELWQ